MVRPLARRGSRQPAVADAPGVEAVPEWDARTAGAKREARLADAAGAPAAGYRSLFASGSFRPLWLGESAGRFGFQLTNFLLPLIAVTALNASGTQVGLIATVQFLPVVAFALVAGALAGRSPLRALLVSCNAVRAAALAFLLAVRAAGGLTIGSLLVVAVLVGAATVFYDVGFQAAIPRAVPVEQITPAKGLLQATYSVSEMGGPAIAGLLLQDSAPASRW